MKFISLDDAYTQISQGGTLLSKFANLLFAYYDDEVKREQQRKAEKEAALLNKTAELTKNDRKNREDPGIVVSGAENLMIRVARCCSPVPGDEIVGFVTRGRGVSIHRTDCINVLCMEENERTRLIDAEWIDSSESGEEKEFTTEINIYTVNRQGMLFDISKIFNEAKIDLKGVNVRINKQGKATVTMQFGIRSKEQLAWITAKLRNVEGVIDIERTRG